MLILTRFVGQSIKIGDDITITLLNIQGAQVALGIKAPRELSVHREEIYEKILKKSRFIGLPRDEEEVFYG